MKTNRIAWICLSLLLLLPLTALAAAPSVVETPSSGLVSWWTGNGSANDFMGVNNGTGTAAFTAGHAGQAFSLDGSTLVSIPDSATLHTPAFSISAWFNWSDLGANTTQFLLGKALEHFEIEMYSTATTNNVRFIPAGYPATFVDAANAIQPGWNHVVVTYSGTEANVYVNGSLAANRTGITGGADLTADGSQLTIGRRGDWSYPFRGLIDDVALYNRVLDAGEAGALYNGGTLRSAAVAGNGGVATLYGTVNDNGSDTTVTFEYGATTAYGSTAAATPAPVTAGSGPAMVSGSTTGLAACGTTYHYRIKAVNGDGTTYGADQVLGLGQCQTITFGSSPALVAGGGGTVTATSNSGLPVTLSTDTPAVCSVSGSTVSARTAGTCTVIATQAGNGVYAPASQTLDLTIGPGNQNISFGPAPVIGVGGTGTVSATSSSGLAITFSSTTPGICTVSGATVTGVAAGTCTIVGSQAGNVTIPAAQSSQSFTITPIGGPTVSTLKPTGLIEMTAPSSVTFNGNSRFQFPVTATLNGVVNAGGDTCTVSFDYGSTTAYGSSAAVGSVGGAAPAPVSAAVSLAWIDDAYYDPVKHYRVKAVCTASGTWYGNDITFAPYTVDRRVNESFGYGNASYPTANIWITPTCSDSQTMANFDINNKNEFDVSLDYDAGGGYKGTVIIGSQQTQQIFVPKGSVASFSYNYTLFEQILTNDRLCSEPQSPSSLVRGDAFGNPGGDGQSQIYALYNDNFAPITLEVMAGSDTFTVTIPARSSQLIATAKAEAQFSYNSEPFMILSPLGGFWANRYLVTAAPVSSTPSTSDFLLQNNDDAAHTVVLRSGGTEHRYTLPPYGSQTVTVEYGAWDLYLVVPGMTGPAMVGDHVKVGSLNPGLYSQSITFGAAPSMVLGGATGTVSATATSGLTASFTSLTTNVCTVSGTAVTAVSVGVCTIAADQAGNGSYAAAPQVTQSFTITGKPTVANVPATGLVSWWPASNSAIDSISGNNGALQGSATYAAGYAGQAFSFDGAAGSYVSVPDSASLRLPQFSASAWFNWADLGTANIGFLLGKGTTHFEIHTGGSNTIRFIPAGYPASYVDSPANAIQPGWNHIVVTYGGGEAKIYMNGVLAASRTGITGADDLSADSSPLSIGRRGDGTYAYNGLIDEVALFNRVLSAGEVSDIHTAGTASFSMTTGAVAGATSATLHGMVNDNLADTTVSFEYGLTSAYGSTTAATPATITAGSGWTTVSASLTGLACSTTYHYRLHAVNANGATDGADHNFTTSPCATLTVTITGSGSVTSHNQSITNYSCNTPGVCPAMTFTYNDSVTLTATESNSTFSGWGGAIIGTDNPYTTLLMDSDKSVTATFTPDPAKVLIDGSASSYYSIGAALDACTQDGTVRAQASPLFVENILMAITRTLKLRGGFTDAGFTDGSQIGYTTISGSLRIRGGELIVDHVWIRP